MRARRKKWFRKHFCAYSATPRGLIRCLRFAPGSSRFSATFAGMTLKKSKPVYRSFLTRPEVTPPGMADHLERRHRQDAVMRAIDGLPTNQRMAVLLSMVEGLSYKDVAQSLNLSLSSVESLLVRAKASYVMIYGTTSERSSDRGR